MGGEDTGELDHDAGGGAAVIGADEDFVDVAFGVEVSADEVGWGGGPVGFLVRGEFGDEVGELDLADGGGAFEGLAKGFPAEVGELVFEVF